MKQKKYQDKLHASFNIIRTGKNYRLVNYGEEYKFEVLEIMNDEDCVIRSLDTLETYQLSDLTKFGKGDDFDFEEI
ncbi:MAG: hypothetical protein ABFS32_06085 [Bacteroidota bacterium]